MLHNCRRTMIRYRFYFALCFKAQLFIKCCTLHLLRRNWIWGGKEPQKTFLGNKQGLICQKLYPHVSDWKHYNLLMNKPQEIVHNLYLSKTSPYFSLNRRVHLFFIYCHCYKLIKNSSDSLALRVVVVFAESNQIGQPGSHVLQTEMFQFNAWNKNSLCNKRLLLVSLNR